MGGVGHVVGDPADVAPEAQEQGAELRDDSSRPAWARLDGLEHLHAHAFHAQAQTPEPWEVRCERVADVIVVIVVLALVDVCGVHLEVLHALWEAPEQLSQIPDGHRTPQILDSPKIDGESSEVAHRI